MSMESAKAFVERMKTDADFAQRVTACKSPESRIQLAKAEGFDFTSEEVKEASEELSEDDLELVSGGSIRSVIDIIGGRGMHSKSFVFDCLANADVCR